MKVVSGITKAVFYIVYFLVWILSLLVFGFSLLTTIRFRQYEQNDLFDVVRDNVPLLILSVAIVFGLIFMAEKAAGRSEKSQDHSEKKTAFPWMMLLSSVALSLFFVLIIHGRATNDALQLDGIMQDFASGNYGALQPGGYLFVYPFQIFYVWTGELIQAVCGPSNFMAYQLLNVISIAVNLYLLYRITWELFEDRDVCLVMQILAVGCVFYDVYATFVYADLWSFAVQTVALYLQILFMKRRKVRYEVGAGVCIAFACLLKSNCYIALIAMMVMLLVDGVMKKEKKVFFQGVLLACMLLFMTRGASAAVDGMTAKIAGLDAFPSGVPAINYIAMGMQEAEGKYGWYNGTNVALYRDAGWDRTESIAAAKEAIQEAVGEFRNSGRYFVRFYVGKFLSQWGDPTCVSMRELEETERHVEPVYQIASWLIFGTGSRILQWIMNVFHSMIWLGMAMFILGMRKHKDTAWNPGVLLLVLFIFGGMVFHEIWEASGRYTMRYYLTMLPLAAWGIQRVAAKIRTCTRYFIKRHSLQAL